MRKTKKLILIFVLIGFCTSSKGQDIGVFSDRTMIGIPSDGSTTNGALNFITPCDAFKINEGKVWVKLDMGENYELGSNTAGTIFNVEVDLELKLNAANESNEVPVVNFSVVLNNNQPEGLVHLDLSQYIDVNDAVTGFTYQNATINSTETTITSVRETTGNSNVLSNLRIGLYYEISYGVSAQNNQVSLISVEKIGNTKVMLFDWEDTCEAPNYQFQLLRLYNIDPNNKNDETIIQSSLNWDKALSFQTYGSQSNIEITIGEGQGYYVWRVRPIGTYYGNGIGDSKNWGAWNQSAYLDEVIIEAENKPELFFFNDVDDQLNYQYSRVFTEGRKISEQISYANSLNQVKQSQRYFSSNNGYKVITQNVLDNSGRPTLNTLPVPTEGKISGYVANFVTVNYNLYKAGEFDEDENYSNPAVIDVTGAFAYYSSLNGDQRIPDAEGYPFTRAIFANDGTDRVVNQSGVGKTHMVGAQENGRGRTTKTIYSTPSLDELVALFGDEAPNHQDVAKIISVDPNNTKSVVFITKEGKTIATGLTFSEDETILESVKPTNGAVVSGKSDIITNNIKTDTGFKSSKRIAILQDETTLNLSYAIAQPILEGLCSNIEISTDYSLSLEIFDAVSGELIHQINKESILDYYVESVNQDLTIQLGTVILNTGSYYIQKTLQPANSVKIEITEADENIRKLIEPYFSWVIDQLDEIDCEEEMQVFYRDLFHYGKLVNDGNLTSSNPILFPSRLSISLPQEFIDYYNQDNGTLEEPDKNADKYSILIKYFEDGKLSVIDYNMDTDLGNKVPVFVEFVTPCCQFEIPITFTPPFRVPSVNAMEAYVSNSVYSSNVNNSTNYNGSTNPINPNYDFLRFTDDNFQYEESQSGEVVITEGNAYPLDFEGYAISMLFECKSTTKPEYTLIEAQQEFYNYMRGWHKPGLFNQMIYHMASDGYKEDSCRYGTTNNPEQSGTENDYHLCDIPQASEALPGTAYTIDDLAQCWEVLVVELVNEICIESLDLHSYAEDTVSSNYDEQNADPSHDDHFNDNIKNFIIRWISKRKLRKKIRSTTIGQGVTPKEEAMKQKNNLVYQFLNCTGYAFADILNPVKNPNDSDYNTVQNNFPFYDSDFDGNLANGEYNNDRLLIGEIGDDWSYFTLDPTDSNSGVSNEYKNPDNEDSNSPYRGILRDLFGNVKDPVYAFKYYEYENNSYPILEGMTCYRDPNLCYDTDVDGNEILVPCCGVNDNGAPLPCNFCGIGYVSCPYTKDDWDCGQRYSFFDMIRNYRENAEEDGLVVNCENYYEQTDYVINPDYGKEPDPNLPNHGFSVHYNTNSLDVISDLKVLSRELLYQYADLTHYNSVDDLYSELESQGKPDLTDIEGNTATTGISLIEDEAYAITADCISNCDSRRNEFKQRLINTFLERCYVIGECKVDSNDNVVPMEDIEALTDLLISQCKKQCAITTYACVDEDCRNIGNTQTGLTPEEMYDYNVSYIDYGVSGPIVSGIIKEKESELLNRFDGNLGDYVTTNELPVISSATNSSGIFNKYSYSVTPTIWEMRKSLTYAEYSRWLQATEWNINLDLPSKCDENGDYNPNITYYPNGLPSITVYVPDRSNGGYTPQNFENCDVPYVTRANPDGPGDTAVLRDEYIKNSTVFPTTEELKKPVVSPKTGIYYSKQTENSSSSNN